MSYQTNDPRGWCGDPSRGAAMGRATIHDAPTDAAIELSLQPIALDEGGYDRNGTYFGSGQQLWWYSSADGEVDGMFRAASRDAAEEKIRKTYPLVTFAPLPSPDVVCEGGGPIEDLVNAYMECALWSSTGEDDEPLDKGRATCDIADETRASMRADCVAFYKANANDIDDQYSDAGHDFWLTRNHHGAGFWDGDWPEPAATRLTEACATFGEVDLYVGDDGKIYSM